MATALGATCLVPLLTHVFDTACEVPEISNSYVMVVENCPHAPYMPTAVPMRLGRKGRKIACLPKKWWTEIAAEVAKKVVKDVLRAAEVVESSHMSPEATAVQIALLKVTETVCCAFDNDF